MTTVRNHTLINASGLVHSGLTAIKAGSTVRFLLICRLAVLLLLGLSSAQAANQRPIADAGSDQTIGVNSTVILDGSHSYDEDGSIKRYRWKQIKGQKVKLKDTKTAVASFITPTALPARSKAKTLVFKLTVTDNRRKKAKDTVTIDLAACTPPQFLVNGSCQSPLPVCYAPNTWQNGECLPPPPPTCDAPLVFLDGACRLVDAECNLPEVLQNGVCAIPVASPMLNDTGITRCSNTADNGHGHDCPFANYPGQDAEFGRDKLANDDSDGHAGFSFSKIDGNGNKLPIEATDWQCIQDETTGLIWEVKTQDGGLRDQAHTYSNYSDLYNPAGEFQAGSDASGYVNAVNAQSLCGLTHWRLPTVSELQGIVHYGLPYPGPAIDTAFFPNTANRQHWTSTPHASKPEEVWLMTFDDGRSFSDVRGQHYYVRLVSGMQAAAAEPALFTVSGDGQEVHDNVTKLIWQRCVVGMNWDQDANTCTGNASFDMWYEVLHVAANASRAAGVVWRIPNIKELASIADTTRIEQAIDKQAFPATPNAQYWSASPYTNDAFFAWLVDFYNGAVYYSYQEDMGALRLVRDPIPETPK